MRFLLEIVRNVKYARNNIISIVTTTIKKLTEKPLWSMARLHKDLKNNKAMFLEIKNNTNQDNKKWKLF